MTTKRRTFSPEFKRETAELVRRGKNQASRVHDVSPGAGRRRPDRLAERRATGKVLLTVRE